MKSRKLHQWVVIMGFATLAIVLFITFLCGVGEGEYSGEFVSGVDKSSDPGRDVRMDITVRNTGTEDTTFYLDDPIVPEGWDFDWPQGNAKNIDADSVGTFPLEIGISEDNDKAEAGLYQFNITGEYENDTKMEDLPGHATLNLTVNVVYGVEVDADDYQDDAEPGESVVFMVEVGNSGNTDDSFMVQVLRASGYEDAKSWTTIEDEYPSYEVFIPMGDKKLLQVTIDVPEFTPGNDEAEAGLFGVKIKAESTNDSREEDEIIFELEVEEFYRVSIWSDFPGKNETLKENDVTEMSFTLFVRNLGNTNDDFIVNVPNDELSGEKKDWRVKFGTQTSKTVTLSSLSQQSVTLDLTIDKNTDPGEYTLNVRAESQGDTSVYVYSTIYINLTAAQFEFELKKITTSSRDVVPQDMAWIEYRLEIKNTGDVEDSYDVTIATQLNSGTYKDWIIEFENKSSVRVAAIEVPRELPGSSDDLLAKNDRVEVRVYVLVDPFEVVGHYDGIEIRVTSLQNSEVTDIVNFSLDVIKPDIRISSDPSAFYIEPDTDIEPGDNIDIVVKVYNDGYAESRPFNVWFYLSENDSVPEQEGQYFAVERINNIQAQSYYELIVTLYGVPIGHNTIFVHADKPIMSGPNATDLFGAFSPAGEILEDNETNNHATIAPRYSDAMEFIPDLSIESVNVTSTTTGANSIISVTIVNQAPFTLPPGYASLQADIDGSLLTDTIHGSNNVFPDALEPNETRTIQYEWNVPVVEGAHNLTVVITISMDKHPEDNEETIILFVTDNVTIGPIVCVESIRIRTPNDSDPTVGDALEIVVTVVNEGNTASNITCVISLKTDPPTELMVLNISLGAGNVSTYTHGWSPTSKGEYTVVVEITHLDPEDNDTSDNTKEFTLEIKGVIEASEAEGTDFVPFLTSLPLAALLFLSAILVTRKKRNKTN